MNPRQATQAAFIFGLRIRLQLAATQQRAVFNRHTAIITGRQVPTSRDGTQISNRCIVGFVFPRVSEKCNKDGQQTSEYNGATGITQSVDYGALGRALSLTDFQDANADGIQQIGETTIAQFTYTYDAAGNRTSAVEIFDQNADGNIDQKQKFTWHYDNLNRLVVETFDDGNNSAADADDYVARYTFDLASNRTSVAKDTGNYDNGAFTADGTTTYTYDANDRLLTVEQSGANTQYTEYTYSATQQTSKTVWADSTKTTKVSQTTYTYNAEGRMSKTQIDSNGDGTVDKTIEYTYANGLRVEKSVTDASGTTTTEYLYDTNNPTGYAQILDQGTDSNHDGKLEASEIDKTFIIGHNVIAQVAGAQLLAFLYDLHGSTRALVNTSGQIDNDSAKGIQAFTFDAYGNMLNTGFGAATQSDALTNLLYSGEPTNAATGLQYLRSRYYDPNVGRFTRMDTYAGNVNDPLSLNKYAYANGNPVMMSDPSGEFGLIGLSFSIGEESRLRAVNLSSLTFVRRGVVNGIANVVIQGTIRRLEGKSLSASNALLNFGIGFATGAAGVGVDRIFKEVLPGLEELGFIQKILYRGGRGLVTGLVASVINVDARYLAGESLTPEKIKDQIIFGTLLGAVFDVGGDAVKDIGKKLAKEAGAISPSKAKELRSLRFAMILSSASGDVDGYIQSAIQYVGQLGTENARQIITNDIGPILSNGDDNGLFSFAENAADAIADAIFG